MHTDPNCIFCKIVAGKVPCAKLLEDDHALAFVDIGPLTEGHSLLIPKEHVETLDALSAESAGAVLRHLPALGRAVRQAVGAEGLNILQNNGKVAGQLVPHVHFHLIPRTTGDAFQFNWPAGEYPQGRLDELAEAIRKAL
jgi:histidine triad (HIT) family protein